MHFGLFEKSCNKNDERNTRKKVLNRLLYLHVQLVDQYLLYFVRCVLLFFLMCLIDHASYDYAARILDSNSFPCTCSEMLKKLTQLKHKNLKNLRIKGFPSKVKSAVMSADYIFKIYI